MQRGDIWWADLPDPTGAGPGFRRPVLIVQADAFTESRIATVIVCVVTSNLGLASAPGNVLVRANDTGLPKDSVVNISQIVTLDKASLSEYSSHLPQRLIDQVESGIRLVLDL